MILLVTAAIAVLWAGILSVQQREMAHKLLRLHVVAASDSEEDQALKLAVRDRVLERADELLSGVSDVSAAERVLTEHLPELADCAAEVAGDWGETRPITVSIEDCWFPTKDYPAFALPAGNYRALRVVIGPGEGHNWWCVVFPSLCVSAASEWADVATASGLSDEDVSLMREDDGYELRFKCLEWLGQLQRWLGE